MEGANQTQAAAAGQPQEVVADQLPVAVAKNQTQVAAVDLVAGQPQEAVADQLRVAVAKN